MTVAHLWLDGRVMEADTTEDQRGATYNRDSAAWKAITRVCTLCSRAEFLADQEQLPVLKRSVSGDASEAALLKYVELAFGNVSNYRQRHKKVAEIPFNSKNKYQVSLNARTKLTSHKNVYSNSRSASTKERTVDNTY